jgi:predicted NAD/FAD-binding protein
MPALMKIAIVGSGISGLSAAWLLRGEHQVVLFERSCRLGGHAETIRLDVGGRPVDVDAAAQFFSTRMYPRFMRLLALLGVPAVDSAASLSIHDAVSGRSLLITPSWSLRDLAATLRRGPLSSLAQLAHVIGAGAELERRGDFTTTVEELTRSLWLTPAFIRRVLHPFLAGTLGCPLDQVPHLSARAALKYPVLHQPTRPLSPFMMKEIEGGTARYVGALAAASGAEIKPGTALRRAFREGERFVLLDDRGERHEVDRLLLSGSARDTLALIGDMPHAAELAAALRRFQYSRTAISIHRDTAGLPASRDRWSYCNYMLDDRRCEATIWVGRRWGLDLFKSWVTHAHRPPSRELSRQTYFHPAFTPDYFRAQAEVGALQGRHGLWLLGSYTEDIDCHESGLCSAIHAARDLAPRSANLRLLERDAPRREAA